MPENKTGFDAKKHPFYKTLITFSAVILFAVVFIFTIQIFFRKNAEEYTRKVSTEDTREKPLRGMISDRNGKAFVETSGLYNLFVDIYTVASDFDGNAEDVQNVTEKLALNLSQLLGTYFENPNGEDDAAEQQRLYSEFLEMFRKKVDSEGNFIDDTAARNGEGFYRGYIVLVKGLSFSERNSINDKLSAVTYGEGIKKKSLARYVDYDYVTHRSYAMQSVAAATLGLVNADGEGISGLESYYNELLKGQTGRTVGIKSNNGLSLSEDKENFIQSPQQYDIYTTLDFNIQSKMESVLTETVEKYNADGAVGILMDVNSFAVLGMANVPGFMSSEPTYYTDDERQQLEDAKIKIAELEAQLAVAQNNTTLTAEEKENAVKSIQDDIAELEALPGEIFAKHTANRAISETYRYEPGSIMKILTAAAALDSGVVDDNTNYAEDYPCSPILLADESEEYHCWVEKEDYDHYNESLADLLKNSCDPFAVKLSQDIGAETFFKYFEDFGLFEKTGIDLSGEASSYTFKNTGEYTPNITLASSSFGQSFLVTPLQTACMVAATVNGGYLYTPYLLDKVLDQDKNLVYQNSPVLRRQVISNETSQKMAQYLYEAVGDGSDLSLPCRVAAVPGYDIGGKSGTSEDLAYRRKTSSDGSGSDGVLRYWASFVAVTPIDDPQYVLLVVVYYPGGDDPDESQPHGGSGVAGTAVQAILSDVLPYLDVHASSGESNVMLPDLKNYSVPEVEQFVQPKLSLRVFGEGEKVTKQVPNANTMLCEGDIVAVGVDTKEIELVTVPNFVGLNTEDAAALAARVGLNIRTTGDSTASVVSQSTQEGIKAYVGTIITLQTETDYHTNDG